MPNWKPLVLPLNKGLDQDTAQNSLTRQNPTMLDCVNADFTLEGAVRGRPGWVRSNVFRVRKPSGSSVSWSTVTGFASTRYSPSGAYTLAVKDHLGERAAIGTIGRLFVHDSAASAWIDHGPLGSAVVKRLGEWYDAANPWFTVNDSTTAMAQQGSCGWDAGPLQPFPSALLSSQYGLLDADGRVSQSTTATVGGLANLVGNGALCGNVSGHLLHVGNGLWLVLHTVGSSTTTTVSLAADVLDATGDTRFLAKPTICCDQASGVFYVAYWTNSSPVNTNKFKVLRVSTSGTVLTTSATFDGGLGGGTDQGGIWISNSDANTNKVVVVWTTGATFGSKVLNATTLADQSIDVTNAGAFIGSSDHSRIVGQVTVGALSTTEATIVATVNINSIDAKMVVLKRSLTSATSTLYLTVPFKVYPRAGNNAVAGAQIYVQHQPVILQGRTLVGISYTRGFSAAIMATHTAGNNGVLPPTATWQVLDITDLSVAGAAFDGGLYYPVTVARSNLETCCPPWTPYGALVGPTGDRYRFPSIEWGDVVAGAFTAVNNIALPDMLVTPTTCGRQGRFGQNEFTWSDAQVGYFGEHTIFSGSAPRAMAGGWTHPVGWFWGERPAVYTDNSVGGGFLSAGSYGVQVVWCWTDEAGKVHRSMPSSRLVQAGVLANEKFVLHFTQPHLNERLNGRVFTEIYVTDANPTTGQTPHYLVGTVDYDSTVAEGTFTVQDVNTSSQLLYTLGGVLSRQTPRADGGIATVGDRCWVSDGRVLYASRLGDEAALNESPSWHVDDTLVVPMPISSGQIVALENYEDKLLVFTETGVWEIAGVGPNDLGQGPAFTSPYRIADVGCAGSGATCVTPQGIVFQAKYTGADGTPEVGGLFALGGQGVRKISDPVKFEFQTDNSVWLSYSPSHEWLLWSELNIGPLVFDLKAGQWSKWDSVDSVRKLAVARGIVFGIGSDPAFLIGPRGSDSFAVTAGFQMILQYNNIPVAGDYGAFGRVRSVYITGDIPLATYNLTVDAVVQNTIAGTGGVANITGPDIEVFLAVQKTNNLNLILTADPATPVWTEMVLQVKGDARNKHAQRGSST